MREFKEVIDETRRMAIMNPLSRNAEAVYFHTDGSPCCIVGHTLDNLGITARYFTSGYFTSGLRIMNHMVTNLPWTAWGFTLPEEYQMSWLFTVQTAADSKVLWPAAVLRADALALSV